MLERVTIGVCSFLFLAVPLAQGQSEDLGRAYNEYKVATAAGDSSAAMEAAAIVASLAETEFPNDAAFLSQRLYELAEAQFNAGDYHASWLTSDRGIDLTEDVWGKDAAELGRPLRLFARALQSDAEYPDAERAYIRAMDIYDSHVGRQTTPSALVRWEYAKFRGLWDRDGKVGLPMILEASQILQTDSNVMPEVLAELFQDMGSLYEFDLKWEEAKSAYLWASDYSGQAAMKDGAITDLLLSLSRVCSRLEEFDEASEWYARAKPGEAILVATRQDRPEFGDPDYELDTMQTGHQAYATVEFTVTPEGLTQDIKVLRAVPWSGVGVSARRYVSKWHYLPLVDDTGIAAGPVQVTETLNFYKKSRSWLGPSGPAGISSGAGASMDR